MKMTKNRLQILELIDSCLPDCGGNPPYSASSIMYTLDTCDIKHTRSGVFRTLSDLFKGGLLARTKQPLDRYEGLDGFQWAYEVASKTEHNKLNTRCDKFCKKALRAMQGVSFFDAVLDYGLPPKEADELIAEGKKLLMLTHPDKVGQAYIERFKRVSTANTALRSGVPLPKSEPPKVDNELQDKLYLPY